MALEKSRITVSLSRLVRIVIFFEFLVPAFSLVASLVVLSVSRHNGLAKSETVIPKPEVAYNAIEHVKEILTLTCYYSYLLVKLALAVVLWKGKNQRSLYKLNIWVTISIILIISAALLGCVAWTEEISYVGLISIVLVVHIIVSLFSIIVFIYFIYKIQSRKIFDYDECVSIRFEPKASTLRLNVASL